MQLAEKFEEVNLHIDVQFIAVGSGQALEMAANSDVDAIMHRHLKSHM